MIFEDRSTLSFLEIEDVGDLVTFRAKDLKGNVVIVTLNSGQVLEMTRGLESWNSRGSNRT